MTHFDPSDWLDRFIAAGGGWYMKDGEPMLCAIEGAYLGDIMPELHSPGRTGAVEAVILDRHARREVWEPAE